MNKWERLEKIERVLEKHQMAVIGEDLLKYVHNRLGCEGRSCVIHNPSQHHMRDWPERWNWATKGVERICPHGIGHPDPDSVAYWKLKGREGLALHGCDGCCREANSGEVVGPQGS